jgi:hypothetical protein
MASVSSFYIMYHKSEQNRKNISTKYHYTFLTFDYILSSLYLHSRHHTKSFLGATAPSGARDSSFTNFLYQT